MVIYSKSSAHSAGPLRPCGLLSLARGPALARALPLALPLRLLWLLRLLYVLLYLLFLLLRLPLFLLAGSANMDPRRSQNRPPGGAQMASWRPLGPRPAPSGRQASPEPPLDGSWSALGGSWSRLGALLAPLGAVWGSPGDPRRLHGRPFWEVFLEVCPGRLKNQRCLMSFTFFEPLFNAFLGRLLSSLGLRRRGRAP